MFEWWWLAAALLSLTTLTWSRPPGSNLGHWVGTQRSNHWATRSKAISWPGNSEVPQPSALLVASYWKRKNTCETINSNIQTSTKFVGYHDQIIFLGLISFNYNFLTEPRTDFRLYCIKVILLIICQKQTLSYRLVN